MHLTACQVSMHVTVCLLPPSPSRGNMLPPYMPLVTFANLRRTTHTRSFVLQVSMYSVLEVGRYTIPELLFVPEFHTGTYQHTLFLFHFF
jgi:hypothetical protein